jgi:hypothetical protein
MGPFVVASHAGMKVAARIRAEWPALAEVTRAGVDVSRRE